MVAKKRDLDDGGRQPGVGVDAHGGDVIDPTKNVLDLVRAQDAAQSAMREALKELMGAKFEGVKDGLRLLSDGIVQYQNGQRESETRRIDQLAETRQEFQNTIRDMLAESVRTTSNLVASQLAQIQATFDTRVSKLEAGAFTQAGKSSVSDPATADALTTMARAVQTLTTSGDKKEGQGIGQRELISYILAAGAIAFAYFKHS